MSSLSFATIQSEERALITGYVVAGGSTAAVGSTPIIASAPAGVYRVSCAVAITTAGTNTLTINVIYTDAQGPHTIAIINGVATTSAVPFSGSVLIENIAAAGINWSSVHTGDAAVWNHYIIVERLF